MPGLFQDKGRVTKNVVGCEVACAFGNAWRDSTPAKGMSSLFCAGDLTAGCVGFEWWRAQLLMRVLRQASL